MRYPILCDACFCFDLAKKLGLDYNKIGGMGAEKLAVALPHLTNLTESWLEPRRCAHSHLHMGESPFWALIPFLPSVIVQCVIEFTAFERRVMVCVIVWPIRGPIGQFVLLFVCFSWFAYVIMRGV